MQRHALLPLLEFKRLMVSGQDGAALRLPFAELVRRTPQPRLVFQIVRIVRARCDAAGLPHCTAHGLRKAAASRLAELGAGESEIMAITGHTTSKEVVRYTRGARQKVLAAKAMARFDEGK